MRTQKITAGTRVVLSVPNFRWKKNENKELFISFSNEDSMDSNSNWECLSELEGDFFEETDGEFIIHVKMDTFIPSSEGYGKIKIPIKEVRTITAFTLSIEDLTKFCSICWN